MNKLTGSKLAHSQCLLEIVIKEWDSYASKYSWESTNEYPSMQGFIEWLQAGEELYNEEALEAARSGV